MCDCVSSEEFVLTDWLESLYKVFEALKFWVNGLSVEGQKKKISKMNKGIMSLEYHEGE